MANDAARAIYDKLRMRRSVRVALGATIRIVAPKPARLISGKTLSSSGGVGPENLGPS